MSLLVEANPFEELPNEIFSYIFRYLPIPDLLGCAHVSHAWFEVANDNAVWDHACGNLWSDKVYVPAKLQSKRKREPKVAYFESIEDAKRTWIFEEELVSLRFSFRFKKAAGSHWLEDDNWWNNRPARKVRFLKDGGVDMNDEGDGWQHFDKRHWRFITTAAGLTGPQGSFIQVNHYPPYVVSRYKNWGFIMQSCWVVYASFPLPPQGEAPDLEDKMLGITTEVMHQEAMQYNMGLHDLDPVHAMNILQLFVNQAMHDQNLDDSDLEDDDAEDEDVLSEGEHDAFEPNDAAAEATEILPLIGDQDNAEL